MALSFSSPDFAPNGAIPERFTCEGEDVSPALEWAYRHLREAHALSYRVRLIAMTVPQLMM
jgi:phosphatidylethanolamine-binding protein (PEBP) family uncharacterized protein